MIPTEIIQNIVKYSRVVNSDLSTRTWKDSELQRAFVNLAIWTDEIDRFITANEKKPTTKE